MKKRLLYLIILTIAFLSFACQDSGKSSGSDIGSMSAGLNGSICASTVEDSFQGTLKNGDPIVDPARIDPLEALGAPDDQFFSLGYGGWMILSFDEYIGGELYVYESTFNRYSYPDENADIYVSGNGIDWKYIGTANNHSEPNVFIIPEYMCIKYVGIVDVTNPGLHGPTSDGFDVDAVCAEYATDCELCGDPLEVNLLAGQYMDAGGVIVTNDEDYLYVTYSTMYNCGGCVKILETHLDIEIDPADFPTTKTGNPKIGHFAYQMVHDPGVNEYTYMIPLADLGYGPGDEIYVAAHAVLRRCTDGLEETAWGEGCQFNDRGSWAMFFRYTIQECDLRPGPDADADLGEVLTK